MAASSVALPVAAPASMVTGSTVPPAKPRRARTREGQLQVELAQLNYLLPRDVLRAMVKEQVTGLTAVPPLYIQLSALEWPAAIDTHLRYFANTGGRMPRTTLDKLRSIGRPLALADVGCAMAGGTDIALATSTLILTRAELGRLQEALHLARRTFSIIKQNLFWAFIYNLVALPLAATGKLAPIHAAAAMALSSLCVVGNSLRLGKTVKREP